MNNHPLFSDYKLSLFDSTHVQQVADYYTRNYNYHKEWSPVPPPDFFTLEFQTSKFKTYKVLNAVDKEYKFVILAGDLLIGIISLTAIERGVFQNGRFGYSIDREFSGQGVMTAAIKALVHYAFTDLFLHRLEANIMPRNIRSKRVLEKCGFQKFGFSPKYLLINNTWEDHDNYMILAE